MTPIRAELLSVIDINNPSGEGFIYLKDGQFYLTNLYTEWSHRAKTFYDDTNSAWKQMPVNGKPSIILDKDENEV